MEQQKQQPKTLTEMVKELRGLLDEKDRLEADAKANKAAIEAKKQEIPRASISTRTATGNSSPGRSGTSISKRSPTTGGRGGSTSAATVPR